MFWGTAEGAGGAKAADSSPLLESDASQFESQHPNHYTSAPLCALSSRTVSLLVRRTLPLRQRILESLDDRVELLLSVQKLLLLLLNGDPLPHRKTRQLHAPKIAIAQQRKLTSAS